MTSLCNVSVYVHIWYERRFDIVSHVPLINNHSFANIEGFFSKLVGSVFVPESHFPDILALFKIKIEMSIDCNIFSMMGWRLLIPKNVLTHAWCGSLFEGVPFTVKIFSWKLRWFYFMLLIGFISFIVLFLFSLSITTYSLGTVFDTVSWNICKLMPVIPSTNSLGFGNLQFRLGNWLTY